MVVPNNPALKFTVEIIVDPDILKMIRGAPGEKESIEESIKGEFGWLEQSGIHLKEITKI